MKRVVVAVAGTAALVVGVAACGDKPVDAVHVLAQAADKTADASSAKFATDVSISGKVTVNVRESGVLDFSGKRATLRLDASNFGIPGLDGDIEARYVDGVVYMDFSKFLAKASDVPPGFEGKRWLRMDISKVVQGAAVLGNDPSSFTNSLQYLRAVDKDGIENLGDAQVRGAETTRYRAEIELGALREKLAKSDVPEVTRRRVEKSLDTITDKTLHEEVWIDHDGRVRRQAFTMHMRVDGETVTMHMSMDYFEFGAAVHADSPPSSEVFDASDLVSGTTS